MTQPPNHVELGWGAPPVSEQFEGWIDPQAAAGFDKDKEAISQLRLRGYLTDSAHKTVVRKFTAALQASLVNYRDKKAAK